MSTNKGLPPYFGGKRKLVDIIVPLFGDERVTVIDLMSGAGNVAWAAKAAGHNVMMNDRMAGPFIIANGLIKNSSEFIDIDNLKRDLIDRVPVNNSRFIDTHFTDIHLPKALSQLSDRMRANIIETTGGDRYYLYMSLLYNFLTYIAPFNMFRYEAFVRQYNEGKKFSRSLQLYADKWTNVISNPLTVLKKLALSINETIITNDSSVVTSNIPYQQFLNDYQHQPDTVLYFDPPYCGARVKYEQGYEIVDQMITNTLTKTPVSDFNNKKLEKQALSSVLKHADKFDRIVFSYWTKLHDNQWFEDLFREHNLHFKHIPLTNYKYSLSGYIGGTGETSGTINQKVDNIELLYVLSHKPIEQHKQGLEAFF